MDYSNLAGMSTEKLTELLAAKESAEANDPGNNEIRLKSIQAIKNALEMRKNNNPDN